MHSSACESVLAMVSVLATVLAMVSETAWCSVAFVPFERTPPSEVHRREP